MKPPCRKEQYGHGDDGLGSGASVQEHYNLARRRRRRRRSTRRKKKKGIGKSDPPRIPLFISLLYLNAPPRAAAVSLLLARCTHTGAVSNILSAVHKFSGSRT